MLEVTAANRELVMFKAMLGLLFREAVNIISPIRGAHLTLLMMVIDNGWTDLVLYEILPHVNLENVYYRLLVS